MDKLLFLNPCMKNILLVNVSVLTISTIEKAN